MVTSLGNSSLVTFAWEHSLDGWDLSLGNLRLGYLAWEVSLGNLRLITFGWGPSLGNFRLGYFTWDLLLGNLRLITFAWDLPLGTSGSRNWAPEAGRTWARRPGEPWPKLHMKTSTTLPPALAPEFPGE